MLHYVAIRSDCQRTWEPCGLAEGLKLASGLAKGALSQCDSLERNGPTWAFLAANPSRSTTPRPLPVLTRRIHDLRHSYASFLVSAGHGLRVIGALLGHTQAATTQRYAHLHDEVIRKATGQVGELVRGAGKRGAKVVNLPRRGGL
jgi:hypothetical protein